MLPGKLLQARDFSSLHVQVDVHPLYFCLNAIPGPSMGGTGGLEKRHEVSEVAVGSGNWNEEVCTGRCSRGDRDVS